MNLFNYNQALLYDKRTFSEYYLSLLKTNHILIFTFITKDDYNSGIIKISLFFFSFSLHYTINSLFFDDSLIHKIYEDKGSFDFIYQIPQICYSTIISKVIIIFVKFLCLSETTIISLKNENYIENSSKIVNCLIAKFIIFYILIFLFLIFFWYYLGCFCSVFVNTQVYLIKDTLISFGLSLFYPFFLELLPGIFRIPSLRNKSKNRRCLFLLSKIIQLI